MKVAILTTDSREHYRDYMAPAPYFGTAPEALLQGLSELPEVEVHVLSAARGRMGSPPKLAPNIFFHSTYVSKPGWMRSLYLGCILAQRRRLRQIKPDIVHGQGTERDCAISAVMSGFPNVVTIHGNMAELTRLFPKQFGLFGKLASKLEDFTLRRTAGVFCNSEYTENLVKSRSQRTWRVPNAIRREFFAEPLSEPKTKRCLLLNIGVITPRKRQLELLGVAHKLHERGCNFEWEFVGDAPATPYTKAFIDKLQAFEAKGFVRYAKTKSTHELIRSLDESSALVHFPSEESFGLVVAEALTRNVKLFGARLGGIKDICAGVESAQLYEVDDWDALTSGLWNWNQSGAVRPSDATEVMRARYHPSIIARRHLEIYHEVLSKRA